MGIAKEINQSSSGLSLDSSLKDVANLNLSHMNYFIENSQKAVLDTQPYTQNANLGLFLIENPNQRISRFDLNLGYLATDDIPEFAYIAQLNENNTLPLNVTAKKAYRIKPLIAVDDNHQFEPLWLIEKSQDFSEVLSTIGLNYAVQEAKIKSSFYLQKYSHSSKGRAAVDGILIDSYQVNFYHLSLPLLRNIISCDADYRAMRKDNRIDFEREIDGERQSLGLNFAFKNLFSNLDSASTTVVENHQWGTYVGESNLDSRNFYSLKLTYGFPWGGVSTVIGKEPGGFICDAGSCSFRPPINGSYTSLNLNNSF